MVKTKKRRKVNFNSGRRSSKSSVNSAQKTILIVIAIASITVAFGIIYVIFFNSEKMVKSQISALATDYYENYFYQKLQNSEQFKQLQDPATALEKYHTDGLSPVTLNDLLLYDNQKNIKYSEYLTKYCDENATVVKFYMDPPYDRTSYHTEITYSCNF